MSENQKVQNSNPLANYFRQPKIWITLPSRGCFYPPDSLDVSSNESYPVYAMTAKDELMFKTPDALLSGQSTVEVIKSCIPAIRDPWKMPSIDLDVCLIGIRVATYGDNMDVSSHCPSCDHENSYEINLVQWLEKFSSFNYIDSINVNELIIKVRPYTYQEVTKNTIKTFEQQRIFAIVNDETMSDEEKLEKFGNSFVKITELTVDIIAGCVESIKTPDGAVTTNQDHIREFINNTSKEVFDTIAKHVTDLKEQIELKPQDVVCEGCGKEFSMPITMDQSNFFDVRS